MRHEQTATRELTLDEVEAVSGGEISCQEAIVVQEVCHVVGDVALALGATGVAGAIFDYGIGLGQRACGK